MQLRQLQYFIAVAEQLNFRKAAEQLYVTQPLLSKQIADLEQEIGYPLFIRNTRSVSLTPAGEVMLDEANKLIRQSSALLSSVKKAAKYGTDYGVLHLGYEESFSQDVLRRILNPLQSSFPGINIILERYSSNELKKYIENGTLDIGFILLPEKHLGKDMDYQILHRERLCLAASKNHFQDDITLEDMLLAANDMSICLLEKNAKGMTTISSLCEHLDVHTNGVVSFKCSR